MEPTLGNTVLYYPPREISATPLAAIIAHVWTHDTVNLMVIDSNGVPQSKTSISQGSTENKWNWMDQNDTQENQEQETEG